MLSDDELWSTGLGTSDSVEAAGETGCGLNAHDGASAGGNSNDGDDCISSLRRKLPP